MTEQSPNQLPHVLVDDGQGNRIRVGRESFVRFDRRMDQQLQHLVDRWAHAAAPAAARTRRKSSTASGH